VEGVDLHQEFTGQVALVTGAAGAGIGKAIARRLAQGGATVIVTDSHEARTKEVTDAISRDYSSRVLGFTLDVSDRRRVNEVLAEVAREAGPVQILVNNAALNVMGDLFDYDPADWDRVIAVDLTGPFNLCRMTLPGMRDAGGGSIINISSISADLPAGSEEPPYAAAKAGLHALTRGIAKAGGPYQIRCNAVTMATVSDTKFMEAHPELLEEALPDTPLGRHATTADIAEAVAFLASNRSSFITGEILNVAGGFYMRT
jgi:NAD(P)-dependent dehydrogenase (short-subunit alcohol dehydrogenase family)